MTVFSCCGALRGAEKAVLCDFGKGETGEWRKSGAALTVRVQPCGVTLETPDTTWARYTLSLDLTPGRTYRIRLEGEGALDVYYRTNHSNRYCFSAHDVFAKGGVWEGEFTPDAMYPASGRLMLKPTRENALVKLTGFVLTPLGRDLPEYGLPVRNELEKNAPKVARGIAFADGRLTKTRGAALRHGYAGMVRIAWNPQEGRALLQSELAIARVYGLVVFLDIADGSESVGAETREMLASCSDVIWAVNPGKEATPEKEEAAFIAWRTAFPRMILAVEAKDFSGAELRRDARMIYVARVDSQETFRKARGFANLFGVPVLARGAAKDSRAFEAAQFSYALDVADDSLLDAILVSAERELVKNAPREAQEASLIRAVKRSRKPGTLTFGFTTDTHYASIPTEGDVTETQPAWVFPDALRQMRHFALLARRIKVDFVSNAGDVINGTLPRRIAEGDLRRVVAAMKEAAAPVFMIIGNHDDGTTYCLKHNNGRPDQALPNETWFEIVTREAMRAGAKGDTVYPKGNYFYMDFPAAKIRVIHLSISENPLTTTPDGKLRLGSLGMFDVSCHQLKWLVRDALDFSGKSDRSQWGIVLVSHCDLERDSMPNGKLLSGVLDAFLCGGRFSGESRPSMLGFFPGRIDCDFTRQGPMRIYCNLYGHQHNQRKYDDYVHGGRYLDLGFPQALAEVNPGLPRRPQGEVDAECFSFVTIDPAAGMLYRFRYGAGCDDVFPLCK